MQKVLQTLMAAAQKASVDESLPFVPFVTDLFIKKSITFIKQFFLIYTYVLLY